MNGAQTIFAGNATRDPELRFIADGTAVAKFGVAINKRQKDSNGNWKDGDPTFLDVSCWRQLAENVAESVHKGDRVIIDGRIEQRSYVTESGEKRTVYEVTADEVGLALSFATAVATRVSRSGNSQPAPASSSI